jgi:hypothetical protein
LTPAASTSFRSTSQFCMAYFPTERAPPQPRELTAGMAPLNVSPEGWRPSAYVLQGRIRGCSWVADVDTKACVGQDAAHCTCRGFFAFEAIFLNRVCRRSLTCACRGNELEARGSLAVLRAQTRAKQSMGAMTARAQGHFRRLIRVR